MFYIDNITGELFHSEDSPNCVVLDLALPNALFHTDRDFDGVHWDDGQGYYRDVHVVTVLDDGEDE